MLKVIVAVLGGGVVGGAIGFAAGIFVYPYIFLADIVATEVVQGLETKQAVATGGYSNSPILANYKAPGFIGRLEKPFLAEELKAILSAARQSA